MARLLLTHELGESEVTFSEILNLLLAKRIVMKTISMFCIGLALVSVLMAGCGAATRGVTSQSSSQSQNDPDSYRSQGEGGWHGGK